MLQLSPCTDNMQALRPQTHVARLHSALYAFIPLPLYIPHMLIQCRHIYIATCYASYLNTISYYLMPIYILISRGWHFYYLLHQPFFFRTESCWLD